MSTFRAKSPPPGPPGPSYMSSKQVAAYLSDLRNNPIPRPNGSRPPPAKFGSIRSQSRSSIRSTSITRPKSEIIVGNMDQVLSQPPSPPGLQGRNSTKKPRPVSVSSFHAGRPLVRQPGADTPASCEEDDISSDGAAEPVLYHERAHRVMEKLEARSLRLALEDLDLEEEERIHLAAQDEASELVWRHQNPNAPYPNQNPNAPYAYESGPKRSFREHLRNAGHVRNSSSTSSIQFKVFDTSSATGESMASGTTSGTTSGKSSRVPSDSSSKGPDSPTLSGSEGGKKKVQWMDDVVPKQPTKAPVSKLPNNGRLPKRTISNGSLSKGAALLRKISGSMKNESKSESIAQSQQEKPAQREESEKKVPIQVRRNPFLRARGSIRSEAPRTAPQTTAGVSAPQAPYSMTPAAQPTKPTRPPVSVLPSETISRSTTNAPPPPKSVSGPEELEKRSDDIRAATSKRLSDRSPNLPTPSFVSDNPNRPIVSFKYDWKPKVVELTPEEQREKLSNIQSEIESNAGSRPGSSAAADSPGRPRTPLRQSPSQSPNTSPKRRESLPAMRNGAAERPGSGHGSVRGVAARFQSPPRMNSFPRGGRAAAAASFEVGPSASTASSRSGEFGARPLPQASGDHSGRPIPTINVDEPPSFSASSRPIPQISVNDTTRPIPTISVGDAASPVAARPIPTISFSDVPAASATPPIPSISVNNAPSISVSTPPIPTIAVNDASNSPIPTISVSPSVPSISVSPDSGPRALPNPSTHRAPAPYRTPHITPAGPLRAHSSALCTACALPISGRVISAGGTHFHPRCFACFQCGELLECVAFYPEPETARTERVERFRAADATGRDEEGRPLDPRDGDEGVRFYCHLDYHEKFSPRCKSCKTPIEGEVVIACGAEWHVGHFFCAECGDPFDSKTPFVEKDGYAWCVNCHTNRYSTKCKKCRKPVTETVINALGAEWHQECFCCVVCSAAFPDGRFFVREDGTDPICVECEQRRLKQ